MAMVRARSKRSAQYILAALACLVLASCSGEEWRWDWWNKESSPPKQKPVTKTTSPRPADEPKTAKAPKAAPSSEKTAPSDESKNAQDKELQDKVDRYVQAMSASSDRPRPGYNDFNAKMQRQQDPSRQTKIKRVSEGGQGDVDASERRASTAPPPIADGDRSGTTGADQPEAKPSEPPSQEVRHVSPTAPEQPRMTHMASTPPQEDRVKIEPARTAEDPTAPRTPEKRPEPEKVGPPSGESTAPTHGAMDHPGKATDTPGVTGPSADKPARPPVLEDVTVSAGPEPGQEPSKQQPVAEQSGTAEAKSPEQPVEEPRATTNAPASPAESADTFQKRLAEQESKVAKDPSNLVELYRLRMMYLIDGQDEKALAPAEGLDAESQRILQTQLRALVSARTASRDPASWATDLLVPVEELREHLRARADLQVPKVVLCSKIEAFGMYEPIEPVQFVAGQRNPVLVYIEVDNFKSERTPSGFFRTLLSVRPSLLSKAGEELWSATYDNIEDLSRQQRHDFFLTVSEVLPPSLAPGEYTLKIEVEDVLAGKINSNTAKFKMATSAELPPAAPDRGARAGKAASK